MGELDELEDIIRRERVECVFVASSAVSPKDMIDISRACRQAEVEMRVSANLPDILTSRLSIQPIDEVMALYLKPVRFTRNPSRVLKRCFDLIVAGRHFDRPVAFDRGDRGGRASRPRAGPVIFRQPRMTKNGRVFTMLKFRTMVADAEHASHAKVADLTEPFFKLRDDPRLTRIGYTFFGSSASMSCPSFGTSFAEI